MWMCAAYNQQYISFMFHLLTKVVIPIEEERLNLHVLLVHKYVSMTHGKTNNNGGNIT